MIYEDSGYGGSSRFLWAGDYPSLHFGVFNDWNDRISSYKLYTTCGDASCDNAESCSSCPGDCGACPVCGDGVCNGSDWCGNCPQDCGACPVCGDNSCDGGESCSSCEADCGACQSQCESNWCGAGYYPYSGSCYDCYSWYQYCSGTGDPLCACAGPACGF